MWVRSFKYYYASTHSPYKQAMDPGPPLVVDNGTGVCIFRSMVCLISLMVVFQYVKVGYAGSNFPEHGQ